MSFWVRSSQIARCRCGQLAVAEVLGSPGQAATLSRVRLSKVVAPLEVKPMLTTQLVPVEPIAALELEMKSPVSRVHTGWYPGSGTLVTVVSSTRLLRY